MCTGDGLREYQVEEDTEGGGLTHCPRLLTVAIDQGSDCFAGQWYCLYKLKLAAVSLGDVSHRIWNDTKLALGSVGLLPVVHLMKTIYNMSYGPWNQQKWHIECAEAAEEYAATVEHSSGCPLFEQLWPLICRDRGECDKICDAAHREAVFQEISQGSPWRLKGRKVSLTRWFAWIDAASGYDGNWHSKLLHIVYVGMKTGVLKDKVDCSFIVEKMKTYKKGREPEKGSVASGATEISSFRDASRNTLHMAALVLMVPDLQVLTWAIVAFTDPVRMAHGQQNSLNRSAGASLQWWGAQAEGAGLESLNATWAKVMSKSTLECIGFEFKHTTLHEDHPKLRSDDELYSQSVAYVVALVAQRLRSMLQSLFLWPYSAAAMGLPDDSVKQACVDEMAIAWHAWQVVLKQDSNFYKRLVRRSCFQWMAVRGLFAVAESARWSPSKAVVDAATRPFRGITQTNIVECSFRNVRKAETTDNNNDRMSNQRRWSMAVTSGILSKDFNFKEVDRSDIHAGEVQGVGPPPKLFRPTFASCSLPKQELAGIVTPGSKASWPTFTPQSSHVLVMDLVGRKVLR